MWFNLKKIMYVKNGNFSMTLFAPNSGIETITYFGGVFEAPVRRGKVLSWHASINFFKILRH